MAVLNNAIAIYTGSTPVDKVMVGVTEVWPAENVAAPAAPAFTQITVDGGTATHEFTQVANATLYRIETEKVG